MKVTYEVTLDENEHLPLYIMRAAGLLEAHAVELRKEAQLGFGNVASGAGHTLSTKDGTLTIVRIAAGVTR